MKLIATMSKANTDCRITELCTIFSIKLSTYYYQQKEKLAKPEVERFFRSLKTEKLNQSSFSNHLSALQAVEQYIQYYNYKRLHSTQGYLTPAQKYKELKKTA